MPNEAKAAQKTRPISVLIVEDEFLMRLMLEDALLDNGYSVDGIAANIEEAIEKIDNRSFDLVILDINLNGVKTFFLADILFQKKTSFIFSTGYALNSIPEEYRHYPALQKPYSIRQLENCIGNVMPDKMPVRV